MLSSYVCCLTLRLWWKSLHVFFFLLAKHTHTFTKKKAKLIPFLWTQRVDEFFLLSQLFCINLTFIFLFFSSSSANRTNWKSKDKILMKFTHTQEHKHEQWLPLQKGIDMMKRWKGGFSFWTFQSSAHTYSLCVFIQW
jgi:hypothetical protein